MRSMLYPYVRILISSINPSVDTRCISLLAVSIRSVIKKRNRIGEMGDLYGIPISVVNSANSPSAVLIVVLLSFRKLLI